MHLSNQPAKIDAPLHPKPMPFCSESHPVPVPSLPPETLDRHLNLDHLRQISEGNLDFERDLLEVFLEDSWLHLARLQEAIATPNPHQFHHSAHHLKGSSANVGAIQIQAIAQHLEHLARHPSFATTLPQSIPLLTQLETALHHLKTLLTHP